MTPVLVENRPPVTIISLNRPERRNAVDRATAEALRIGLANRVVPAGQALDAALELAARLAAFPQSGLRNDRASVLDQEHLDLDAALRYEFEYGTASLAADTAAGVGRFVAGAGRHGAFEG